MTQPAAQGFPDYQRNRPAANVRYLFASEIINASKQYGTFFVGYTPYVSLNWLSISGWATVVFDFYADQAKTLFIQTYQVSITDTGNANFAFPTRGPWMNVTVNPVAAGFNHQIILSAAESAGNVGNSPAPNVLFSSENVAINAGLSAAFTVPGTWPGKAVFSVTGLVTNWSASIVGITSGGTRVPIFEWVEKVAFSICEEVYLPSMPVQVNFTNNTAGVNHYYMNLVGHPWEGFG